MRRRGVGFSTASAARCATGTILHPDCPDALSQVWSALGAENSGEVLLSAGAGYEFIDWGRQAHVGGGSHGSLHASELAGGAGAEAASRSRPGACPVGHPGRRTDRQRALRAGPGGSLTAGRAPPGGGGDASAAAGCPRVMRAPAMHRVPAAVPPRVGGRGDRSRRLQGGERREHTPARSAREAAAAARRRGGSRSRFRPRTVPPKGRRGCRQARPGEGGGAPKDESHRAREPRLLRRRLSEGADAVAGELLLAVKKGDRPGNRRGPRRRRGANSGPASRSPGRWRAVIRARAAQRVNTLCMCGSPLSPCLLHSEEQPAGRCRC